MAKSIATVSISGTLAEKLEAAAAIGFDGVEIFENDLLTFEGSPQDIRYLAESLGLTVSIRWRWATTCPACPSCRHAYTDPFDDRFFFETVQRIGDYQQYGAANGLGADGGPGEAAGYGPPVRIARVRKTR